MTFKWVNKYLRNFIYFCKTGLANICQVFVSSLFWTDISCLDVSNSLLTSLFISILSSTKSKTLPDSNPTKPSFSKTYQNVQLVYLLHLIDYKCNKRRDQI